MGALLGWALLLVYVLGAVAAARAMLAWRADNLAWSIRRDDPVPLWAVILVPIVWPIVLAVLLARAARRNRPC